MLGAAGANEVATRGSIVVTGLGFVALADANARGLVHPPSVRQLLEQRRAEAGRPVALSAEVPQDPRLRDVVIHPHALGLYDQLQSPADKEHDDDRID